MEPESIETDLLNKELLTDIANHLEREIVLFQESGRKYEYQLRTETLHDDEVILVKCADETVAHSRSMEFCLQQYHCPFCCTIFTDRFNCLRHKKDCKYKGGYMTNIDYNLQTTTYKTGRRMNLVKRTIYEELDAAGIRFKHPKSYFFHTRVLACDCETMLEPIKKGHSFIASREHTQTAKNAISFHTLLMFGSYSNIQGLEKFTCIERDFSDPGKMADDILKHWNDVADVSEKIEHEKFKYYFNQIKKLQKTCNPNSPYSKMLCTLTKKLEEHCSKLSIVFFNLQYDQHILLKVSVICA